MAEVMERRQALTRDAVMDGVPELVDPVQAAATFLNYAKLVSAHDTIV